MVIYVDVLIFINAVVDYLLLSTTALLTKSTPKFWRKLTAAIVASLFSLYIFLPPFDIAQQLFLMLCSSLVAVLVTFGFNYLKGFIRCTFVFYGVTFLFGGLMTAIYILFKPQRMSINNGVVYFDISPLVLITVTFLFYIVIWFFKKLSRRDADCAERCIAEIKLKNISLVKAAMLDTGHTLQDGFSGKTVIIIDKPTAVELVDSFNVDKMLSLNPPDNELGLGFRLIPTNTVSGESVLPAIVLESIRLKINKRTVFIDKPIAVISKLSFTEDYSVIVPPEAVN